MFQKTLTVCLTGAFLFRLGVDLIEYATTHQAVSHPDLLVLLILVGIGIAIWPGKKN